MIIFIIINIKRDVAATTLKTDLNFMTFEMIFIIIFILSCSGNIDRKSSSLWSIRHKQTLTKTKTIIMININDIRNLSLKAKSSLPP